LVKITVPCCQKYTPIDCFLAILPTGYRLDDDAKLLSHDYRS